MKQRESIHSWSDPLYILPNITKISDIKVMGCTRICHQNLFKGDNSNRKRWQVFLNAVQPLDLILIFAFFFTLMYDPTQYYQDISKSFKVTERTCFQLLTNLRLITISLILSVRDNLISLPSRYMKSKRRRTDVEATS